MAVTAGERCGLGGWLPGVTSNIPAGSVRMGSEAENKFSLEVSTMGTIRMRKERQPRRSEGPGGFKHSAAPGVIR